MKKALAIFTMLTAQYAGAAEPAPAKAEIQQIVREYILEHPELIIEAAQSHRERERAKQQRLSADAIRTHQTDLLNDSASPVAGDAAATQAVVMFFDYQCGHCKRADAAVLKLATEKPGVRVIFKELPILGPQSSLAAAAALAADKQGAYLKFHGALMESTEAVTLQAVERLALKLGLDAGRLRADMESGQIGESLARNRRLADQIGVRATPSFVIGGELVSGAIDRSSFNSLLEKARTSPPSGL